MSSKKKYVILDKITDQFLTSFVDSVDEWIERDSDVSPSDFNKSAVFDSVDSARRVVEILNHQFKDEEEGIDFVVMEATEKRVVTYEFHEIVKPTRKSQGSS